MNVAARYYDEPFLNPKLSPSLMNSARENARKIQLLAQHAVMGGSGGLCLGQIERRVALRAFAGHNYIPAAVKAEFGA